ncbi:MAG: EamA family transporter [Candidatus Omnitrophota bacterium]
MSVINWIFLLLTILCWGVTPIIERYALNTVKPLDGLFIRSAGVFVIFLVFFVPTGRAKVVFDLPIKSIVFFLISGALAGFLGMYFYFHVLRANPSSKIVPLTATYPLITMFLSVAFLREDFSWQRVAGTILIIIGIFLVK